MMRAADAVQCMQSFPLLDFNQAFPDGGLAILAPHPDDESLGCGGLIAEACAQGRPPRVFILTDGTGSHPNSRLYPAHRLRALREAETRAATAKLGLPPGHVTFLGYRDTDAPSEGPALQEAAGHLCAMLRRTECRTLLAPWRHDPHCDHQAAAAIAIAGSRRMDCRVLAYPVWGLTLPFDTPLPEDQCTGFRINIAPHLAQKKAAIQAHASQYAGFIQDDPDGFQMQPAFIELFLQDTEIFLDVPNSPAPSL
jgi:LmbE family N-acetylglucosaminyl deacetylase